MPLNSPLPVADVVVLALYLALIVGLGCRFFQRSRIAVNFMVAGRSLPGWVVGLSIFGTYVSSISFLANPGKSYQSNWNPFVFSLGLPVAAVIAVRYFVPFYRSSGEISAYAHLERRFGGWARTYAVFCYLLTQFARIGTVLLLVALALSPVTGWSVVTIILMTGVLVTLYTMVGGVEAVIWTDVVQSFVLGGGMLVSAGYLLFTFPGGPSHLVALASEHGKFSLGSTAFSFVEPSVWVVLLYSLFMNLQNFGIDQSFVQRYSAARSDRDAAGSVWLATLLYVPVSALLFFIGTALYAYYSVHPELLAAIQNLRPDEVFPHFIVHQLPVGVTGLLLAAILAAAMSSIDTSLNSSATLTLCDIYKRYFRPEAGERESMRVLYLASLGWGIAGTATALAMIRVGTILDAWWKLSGVFSGGMLGLFLLGLIARRARGAEAAIAVTVGVLVIFWATLSPTDAWPESLRFLSSPFHSFMITVVGTLTVLLVGILLTRLRNGASRATEPDLL